jgi:hypothetical protein
LPSQLKASKGTDLGSRDSRSHIFLQKWQDLILFFFILARHMSQNKRIDIKTWLQWSKTRSERPTDICSRSNWKFWRTGINTAIKHLLSWKAIYLRETEVRICNDDGTIFTRQNSWIPSKSLNRNGEHDKILCDSIGNGRTPKSIWVLNAIRLTLEYFAQFRLGTFRSFASSFNQFQWIARLHFPESGLLGDDQLSANSAKRLHQYGNLNTQSHLEYSDKAPAMFSFQTPWIFAE